MLSDLHLCYITDRHALAPLPLLPHVHAAVRAGVDLIQLREKDLATDILAELARAAMASSAGSETRIIINDRLDIAVSVGASGVQLGVNSVAPKAVRRHVEKDFLVGVSCHSLEEALKAEEGGGDFILLGPVFDTPSKRAYGLPIGLDKLSVIASRTKIPVLALGGITIEGAGLCLEAGATGIAGIRLFQDCPSLEDRVSELREIVALHGPRHT